MKNNKIFNFALMIILYIFNMMFVTSLLFICKIKITSFNFIISIFLTFLTFFILMKKKKYNIKEIVLNISTLLIIILLSTFISGKIYDTTYDGNAYHKTAVGELKNGWNPVYQTIDEFNNSNENQLQLAETFDIWNDHYAKGYYFYAASLYKITENIETGKSIYLLLIVSTFLLLFNAFSTKLKPTLNLFLSGLITLNPVTICQMFTYYNDGLLANFLIILLISLSLMITKNDIDKKLNYLLFFITLCILINIKFTGFAYAGIYSLVFYIYILLKKDKRKEHLKNITILGIISIIVGVFIIGLSTYPKNFKTNGHPFYPLYGEGKVDIMKKNAPKDFYKKYNRFERIFISNFANVSSGKNMIDMKIPLTTTKEELDFYRNPDIRLGGFGPFYGGILIFSVFSLIYIIIKIKKDKTKIENLPTYLIVSITTLSLMIILKDAWWARYIPQFYLIPLTLILILLDLNKTKLSKVINIIFIVLMIINIGLVSYPLLKNTLSDTIQINYNLNRLEIDDDTTIFIETDEFNGTVYNIKDKYKNVENVLKINNSDEYKKENLFELYTIHIDIYYKE